MDPQQNDRSELKQAALILSYVVIFVLVMQLFQGRVSGFIYVNF